MASQTVLPAASVPADWMKRASSAMLEAHIMSGSISKLAVILMESTADPDVPPLAEAIIACASRIEAAVGPIADEAVPEVAHV